MTNKAEGTHLVSEQDKELQITPGEAYFEPHYQGDYYGNITVLKSPGIIQTITLQLKYAPPDEQRDNAALYVDAHNTYNACKKLPSALLREKDAAVEALSKLMDSIQPMNYPERDWRKGYADMKERGIGSRTMPSEESVMKALDFLSTLTPDQK